MEAIFQRLEEHITFICPECGETFELQQQWRQHLNFHHDYLCKTPEDFDFVEVNERYHECLKCNQLVADGRKAIALLQYHRFVHLPHKCTYRCRHCFGTFMRKRICFNHLCRVHEDIVGAKLAAAAMKTPMLSNKKGSVKLMSDSSSIARHNPEFYLRHICPQCGYEVSSTDDWLKHIEDAHSLSLQPNNAIEKLADTDEFLCNICEKIIYSNDKQKHQRHYYMHLPHKVMYRCAYCKIRRPFKSEILYHFMTTHLLVFEKQRIFMRKPKEFGYEINKKLEKEIDLLLKYGNNVGAPQGSTWPKLPPANGIDKKQRKQRSSTPLTKKSLAEESGIIQTAIVSSLANLNAAPTENMNKSSNIKKELDALCAEIMEGIVNDDEEKIVQPTQANLMGDDYMVQDNIEHVNNENNFSIENKNIEEEIVSIEINALDENELNHFNNSNENTQSSSDAFMSEILPVGATEIYPSLKALYNAKVLHLCPECGVSFAEQPTWREHVVKTHENLYKVEQSFMLLDDQSNLCLTCNTLLYTTAREELQRHRFSHMPYSQKYLKCTLCEKYEKNKPQMFEHLANYHGCFVKSTNEHNKTPSELPNLNCPETTEHINKIPKMEETFQQPCIQTNAENGDDCASLLNHLQKARERLQRMAAEYGKA